MRGSNLVSLTDEIRYCGFCQVRKEGRKNGANDDRRGNNLNFLDIRTVRAVVLNRAISRCVTGLRVHSPVVDPPPSSSGRTTTACTRIPRVLFRTSNYSNVTGSRTREGKSEEKKKEEEEEEEWSAKHMRRT